MLLAIFRGEPGPTEMPFWGTVERWVWLRTEWWGILGLIGWAYLTTAILWLVLGRRREWLMGCLAILMLLHLAMQRGGLFTRLDNKTWLGLGDACASRTGRECDRSARSVCQSGRRHRFARGDLDGRLPARNDSQPRQRRRDAPRSTPLGADVRHRPLLAGLITDTFEGINKNAATPTWCLWSAALTCLAWMLLYLVIDVAGFQCWTILVRPAGANPLLAYFLHPIIVALIVVAGLGADYSLIKMRATPMSSMAGSLGNGAVCLLPSRVFWVGSVSRPGYERSTPRDQCIMFTGARRYTWRVGDTSRASSTISFSSRP